MKGPGMDACLADFAPMKLNSGGMGMTWGNFEGVQLLKLHPLEICSKEVPLRLSRIITPTTL